MLSSLHSIPCYTVLGHGRLIRPQLSAASPTNRPQLKVIITKVIIWLKLWLAAGCEATVKAQLSSCALHNKNTTAKCPTAQLQHWYLQRRNSTTLLKQLGCYHGVPAQLLSWSTCVGTPQYHWRYFKEAATLLLCRYQCCDCGMGYCVACHINLAVVIVAVDSRKPWCDQKNQAIILSFKIIKYQISSKWYYV